MKKALSLLFAFSMLLCSIEANSQILTKSQQKTVDKLFKKHGEVYFKFNITSKVEINSLTKIISIDNVKNNEVVAYANKSGFAKFIVLNYQYTVLSPPSSLNKVKMGKGKSFTQVQTIWNTYPTYPNYETIMNQFVIDHPGICKLITIATLPSGRKLMLLKISDNINAKENEPQFLYTSTMHGDETAGYIGMLHYIDFLLTNYGTDARVTNLVNNMEIWICPLANPDGTYAGGNATVNGATRFNGNNIDLNRNYPDPQAGQHPDGNAWQPETQAFMAFADTMNFVMAANFHGGAEVVNYPWDTWAQLSADDNWWVRESSKYADTAMANAPAGYFTSVTPSGITNGFAWYTITGGRQDYMNYYKHCREFTLELSDIKLTPASDLLTNWNDNYRSWLNYMEEALHGIRGTIKDACTNQPIKAKVFISGHDFDSSHVYSALPVGNYHRPIYQGTYNVTYSAAGYQSQTINNIVITDGNATIQNISLNPISPVVNFAAAITSACGGTVDFTDLSGSSTSWFWTFGDGATSLQQNSTHVYTASGTYTIQLKVTNCAGADSLIKTNYVTVTVVNAPIVLSATAPGCGPASVVLTAFGSGTLNWYDAATAGNIVNTGTSYTTPTLSSTTTYYVESDAGAGSQYVGALNSSIGAGGYFTAGTYHYLVFTSSSAFTLVSVWVNANTAGNRTIELRNSAGTVLQSLVVNVPSGQNRITLNFNVPVGVDLQLGVAGNNNLYRNSAAAAYPYSLVGIVSITGNSANNLAYYYYFYDWEIKQGCTSVLVPVTATINPGTNVGASIAASSSFCAGSIATFTANASNGGTAPSYQWQVNGSNVGTNSSTFSSSVLINGDVVTCIINSSNSCAINNPETSNSLSVLINPLPSTPVITLSGATLTSSAASGNQWYNGSGIILDETGSSYSPTQNGNYFVIVTDGNGCSSDSSNLILITGVDESSAVSFSIYPNPNNGDFIVELKNFNNEETLVELVSVLGQSVYSEKTTNKKIHINSMNFSTGIYFLKVSSERYTKIQKMIVQKKAN